MEDGDEEKKDCSDHILCCLFSVRDCICHSRRGCRICARTAVTPKVSPRKTYTRSADSREARTGKIYTGKANTRKTYTAMG